MDVLEFNRRFMQIEEELRLFPDTRVSEPGWWDAVRHDVMKLVYNSVTGVVSEVPPPLGFGNRLRHLATRILLRAALELRLRLFHHDVLVYRAPRLLRGGRRIDTGLDQVLGSCPGRVLVINTFPHRYDRSFAGPFDLAPRPAALGELERRIKAEFDADVDLDHFVRQRLADFAIGYRRYRAVIERVRPRLVLLNQNGIEKALFRAARDACVPSIEVQHGLINGAHPAYAYPRSVSGDGGAMFPDLMFAFSQFWIDGCHYPARRRIAVGNDAFNPGRLGLPPSDGAVLVISAPKYHQALVRWLRVAAPRAGTRRFIYKLHPSQSDYFSAIRVELADLPNVAVRSTDVTVQALLAEAADVLLIQSTVAYEAVQARRRLLIIPEFDYGALADLWHLPGVTVVSDADALATALSEAPAIAEPPTFFEPFNDALAARVLQHMYATGEPPAHAEAVVALMQNGR